MTDFQVIFKPTEPEQKPPDIDLMAQEFQTSDWSIHEAYMCLILCAAYADHQLAEEEKQEIAALVKRSRTMKRLTGAELANVNQSVVSRLRERKDALQEACVALPGDMRPSVFAHCVDIVLADGQLLPAEATFLNDITRMMALDANQALEIKRVVMTKNRY
ncbi:MAG: tellurite resistance TerB family protein [Hyphomonas sp.]